MALVVNRPSVRRLILWIHPAEHKVSIQWREHIALLQYSTNYCVINKMGSTLTDLNRKETLTQANPIYISQCDLDWYLMLRQIKQYIYISDDPLTDYYPSAFLRSKPSIITHFLLIVPWKELRYHITQPVPAAWPLKSGRVLVNVIKEDQLIYNKYMTTLYDQQRMTMV